MSLTVEFAEFLDDDEWEKIEDSLAMALEGFFYENGIDIEKFTIEHFGLTEDKELYYGLTERHE